MGNMGNNGRKNRASRSRKRGNEHTKNVETDTTLEEVVERENEVREGEHHNVVLVPVDLEVPSSSSQKK